MVAFAGGGCGFPFDNIYAQIVVTDNRNPDIYLTTVTLTTVTLTADNRNPDNRNPDESTTIAPNISILS